MCPYSQGEDTLGKDLDEEVDNCSSVVSTHMVRSENECVWGKHSAQAWNKALTFQNIFAHSKEFQLSSEMRSQPYIVSFLLRSSIFLWCGESSLSGPGSWILNHQLCFCGKLAQGQVPPWMQGGHRMGDGCDGCRWRGGLAHVIHALWTDTCFEPSAVCPIHSQCLNAGRGW